MKKNSAPTVVWRLAQWASRRWREFFQTIGSCLLGERGSTTYPPSDLSIILDFTVPHTGGSAAESAHAPPPVAAQNNTQILPPANGPVPWLSEAAQTQVSPPDGHEQSPGDDIGASDGTTGETEALTATISNISLHADEAVTRVSSIPNIEKKHINDAMSLAVIITPIKNSIQVLYSKTI